MSNEQANNKPSPNPQSQNQSSGRPQQPSDRNQPKNPAQGDKEAVQREENEGPANKKRTGSDY